MIHYVVVAGTPEAIGRLSPLLLPSLRGTRWFDGTETRHTCPTRTWAVAAISVADPMCGHRLAVDGTSMAVVNGPALVTAGSQRNLAHEVLGAFSAGGTQAVASKLAGGYNFVGITPSMGLHAFPDFSGIAPLYWHQGEDFAAFSNRSTTLAALTRDEAWDLHALAWVVGTANLYGERMPAHAATYLPPGMEARVRWGGAKVRLDRSPVWVWPARSTEHGRENLSSAEWDEITHDLIGNFRVLRSFGQPIRLYLSGGKDSRLCLALAKAAGLDDVLQLRTNGRVDSPEVECAAAVAKAAGLPHERIGPSADHVRADGPATEPPWNVWWRQLRQHVYRFEAIVSPWDGMMNPTSDMTLNVRGIGGELYRRGNVKRLRKKPVSSTKELAQLHGRLSDPLRVLSSHERALQDEWRCGWFDSTSRDVRFDLLAEKWYVDYRLGHWNGPLAQAKAGYINVVPLLASTAARKNMELSPESRGADRFHFEVMRRAAPELVEVPFLADAWAPSIVETSPMELPREAFEVAIQPTVQVLRRPKWNFVQAEPSAIGHLLDDAASVTQIETVCDVEKLKQAADHAEDLRSPQLKELFSAIGVAIALLGRAEPSIDHLVGTGVSGGED